MGSRWYLFTRGFRDSLPSAYRLGEAAYFFGNLLLWVAVFVGSCVGVAAMISNYEGAQHECRAEHRPG